MNLETTLISVLVPILTALLIFYLMRRETNRQMSALTDEFKPLVSKVFGMAGVKSADSKALKALEGSIADDIQANMLGQFPEIEMVLGWLSPDTLERIKEHPEALPILIQRYAPLIGMFMGKATGKQESSQWDY